MMRPSSAFCRPAQCLQQSRSALGAHRSGTHPRKRKLPKPNQGLTVADLLGTGATALGDNDLKELVVGKNLTVRNYVTGETSNVLFGVDGKRIITELDGDPARGGDLLQVMHNVSSSSASYEIKDGHIVTTIDGTPFELTVYRSGDKYVAARSNEFGYANYEVEAVEK